MSQAITVTYYVTDDGWVYSDSFGLAMLEGRCSSRVGVSRKKGRRVLTLPDRLDDKDVYIISFDGEYDNRIEEVVIPEGVGIIGPRAFCGWKKLRKISVPDSVQEVSKGAFSGTAIPRKRRRELYARKLAVTEIKNAENVSFRKE